MSFIVKTSCPLIVNIEGSTLIPSDEGTKDGFLLGNGLEFNSISRQVAESDFSEDIIMSGFVDGETLLDYKKRVENGEKFEELAKLYSEDLGSGKRGGDLGFAKRGQMVAPFEAAALRMKPMILATAS